MLSSPRVVTSETEKLLMKQEKKKVNAQPNYIYIFRISHKGVFRSVNRNRQLSVFYMRSRQRL